VSNSVLTSGRQNVSYSVLTDIGHFCPGDFVCGDGTAMCLWPAGSQKLLTGLEGTAPNGLGWGIEPFRPVGEEVKIGLNSRVAIHKVRGSN
jgi:hypothetical protein